MYYNFNREHNVFIIVCALLNKKKRKKKMINKNAFTFLCKS